MHGSTHSEMDALAMQDALERVACLHGTRVRADGTITTHRQREPEFEYPDLDYYISNDKQHIRKQTYQLVESSISGHSSTYLWRKVTEDQEAATLRKERDKAESIARLEDALRPYGFHLSSSYWRDGDYEILQQLSDLLVQRNNRADTLKSVRSSVPGTELLLVSGNVIVQTFKLKGS